MRDSLATVGRSFIFVILALALCAVVFQACRYNAPLMIWSVIEGAFFRNGAIVQSLRWALPLFITAAGVAISFRAGFFNIGAQGQFYVGAIAAATAAHFLSGGPAFVVIPLIFLAGICGGAIWALWPGLLRLSSGTDEVITTLMGNFLAGLLLIYVTSGPLKDPSGSGQQASSKPLDPAYRMSDSLGLSPTIIAIALIVGIATWLLVNRTAFGVLAGLAGRNVVMVKWQGARIWKLGLSSFLISGALAGLAGTIEFMGPNGRIVSGFLPAHGFTAILIALVANLSIVGTAVTAIFFGGLSAAALYLPIIAGLPASAIDIINAAIALFITAKSNFIDRVFGVGSQPK
ncbi:ABC transporter permease [Agrobacterium larrymoorei]|uniref:ABC transporter permease n=1 Tax=Agrobacterium larrymoorei TaxID=160699 RepID=A0A4D7DVI2_9HYPH|nr:ABC transporter permease [Agrobacterium larrymoorei]QCJ01084.1 ABC transporter permease [Agrobacterium larrymoorei]QYA10101.1 ABC transporter permease [Agrobacterium larrymoorei]